jgi:hypothetical protein
MRLCFLVAFVVLLSVAFADQERTSRLSYVRPDGWSHSSSDQSGLGSITASNGGVAVTFIASTKFSGSAEQWQHDKWSGILERMRLAGPSQAGLQGQFLTRTGIFNQPDGSHPWVCLYTLVNEGRGEGVVYVAANEALFRSQLETVNQLIQHITIGGAPDDDSARIARNPARDFSGDSPPRNSDWSASNPGHKTMNSLPNANDTEPVLNYDEPARFYRGASKSPIEYSSSEVNASVQVYPFRPFTGDIQKMFQQTMLREWLDARYRETALSAPPQFALSRVSGADVAFTSRFHEAIVGQPNERMRMVVVVDNRAALVDVTANSTYSWEKAGPSIRAMLDSFRVERRAASPSVASGPGPGAKEFAGMYMGSKGKYVVNFNRAAGFGDIKLALHYYLFTPDGRVHCCYDFPPGGPDHDWKGFDFDRARREDPQNTGRYTLKGDQLFIQMANTPSELIVGTIQDSERLEIETVKYARQR